MKVIICGSAAAWITKNTLQNKGGLHNRVTLRLPISSFSLKETKAYLKAKGVRYDNYQILQLYICIGGIPYYLKLVEKGFSAIQNVNHLCFKKKGTLFDEKVIDEYTLFYLYWIAPKAKSRITKELTTRSWEQISQTTGWKAWAGYAFEAVCYKHLPNIRKSLAIPDGSASGVWRDAPHKSVEQGAQIDLLFDRPDGIVQICEIKHCAILFVIDKAYGKALLKKAEIYQKVTKTEKQIFISMITSAKLKKKYLLRRNYSFRDNA